MRAPRDDHGAVDRAEVLVPFGVSPGLLDGPPRQPVRASILLRSQPVLGAISARRSQPSDSLRSPGGALATERDLSRMTSPDRRALERLDERRTAAIRSLMSATRAGDAAAEPLAAAIEAGGGSVLSRSALPSSLVATVPRAQLERLARRDDVQAISPASEPRPLLDEAAVSLGATSWWAEEHRGGTGDADPIRADVSMYLDYPNPDHPAFAGMELRLDQQANPDGPKVPGHGTTTASEIASQDSTYRGLAHGVDKLISGDLDYSLGLLSNDERSLDPAEVISFSFGSQDDKEARGAEVDAAIAAFGVTLSAAAGNGGPNGNNIAEPAIGRNVIAVGATDDMSTVDPSDDVMADISSRGPTESGRKKPDLVAPATHVMANGNWDQPAQPVWAESTPATSWAAPIVSAGALLLWGSSIADPNAQKAILINSARPGRSAPEQPMGTQTGWQPDWGWGMVDLDKALADRANYVAGPAHQVESDGYRLYRASVAAADKATLTWRLRGTYSGDSNPHLAYTVSDLDLRQYRAADQVEIAPAPNPNGAGPDAVDPNDTVEQVRSPAAQSVIYKVEAGEVVDPEAEVPAEPFALAAEAPLVELEPPRVEVAEAQTNATAPVACGDPVEVSAKLRNPSPHLAASAAQLRLDLPAGVELVSGDAAQTVAGGSLAAGTTSPTHSWTVQATSDGAKALAITGSTDTLDEPYSDAEQASFAAECPPPPEGGGGTGDDPPPSQQPAAKPAPPAVKVSGLSLSESLPSQCGAPLRIETRLLNDSPTDARSAAVVLVPGDGTALAAGEAVQTVAGGHLAAGATSEPHAWSVRPLREGASEVTLAGFGEAAGSWHSYPRAVGLECRRYAAKLKPGKARARKGGILAKGLVFPRERGSSLTGKVALRASNGGERLRTKTSVRPDGTFKARLRPCEPGKWRVRGRYLGDAGYMPDRAGWRGRIKLPARAVRCREQRRR